MNTPDRMPISVIARHKHPGRSFWLLGLLIAALAVSQVPVFAQFASGSIGATVTDATGAIVPAAKVTLKNEATGALRDTVTNNSGAFDFPSILPATYTVTVTAAGLQTFEETGITLTQGATLRLPTIILQVQSTKQEVEVVAGADVVVPTDSGTASQTLNKNMIENISIAGRDAAELIKIMPGMGLAGGLTQSEWGQGSVATSSNNGPIGNFSAQGAPLYGGVTMTSDGANLLDPGNQGTQTANINQNQVQEVSILTSAYGAEFAKGPVTFQAIGKSGGAQFHGQAYLYARNGVFDSNGSYNNSQGVQAPTNSFYYPGGDFGGPVIIPHTNFNKNHDKLFFYAAFEYMDQHPAGGLLSYFVPTAQMQAGNFTPAYLATLGPGFKNNMYQDSAAPSTTLFPTGQIPASQLDPNSAILMKLMPQPNINPVTNPGGYNYQYFDAPPVNRWELRLRGDYNISDKTKLFFSWNHQLEHDQNPLSIWWNTDGALPYPSSQNANQDSNVYSANLVHVFSPTLTNEFVFAEATFLNPVILGNPAAVNPSTLGFSMTGLFSNPYTAQIPNSYGYGGQSSGDVGLDTYTYGEPFTPTPKNGFGKLSQTPQISDNVTKIQGSHTLKAGVYWDYARNYQTSGSLTSGTQGSADFDPWGNQSTGNYLANFVTGRMTNFAQDNAEAVQDMKYHQVSFFINDQWKASRRLTLTGGLRFEHMGNWVPNDSEGVAVWDPATYNNTSSAPGWTGLEWHSIDSSIPLTGFPTKTLFVEPRFGFAYDIFGTGKTVVRGGAGLFRYQISYNSASSGYNPPLGLETEGILTGAGQCCVGWNQFAQYAAGLGAPGLGTGISPLTMGDDRTPNTWTYNVTISQRTPWRSVAEFQYAGSRSRDLLTNGGQGLGNVDDIPLGAFFGVDPITGINYSAQGKIPVGYGSLTGFPNLNDFYPYHNYTGISLQGHESYSNYNAFIATWQKQSGRMTFTTNYTFSKNLGVRDNNSANGNSNGSADWPFSPAANYGVLAEDHTHIFNAAYVFNLPSPVKDNKLMGGVVNGWVLSGITQAQSGAPIQPNTNSLNVSWPTQLQPSDYLGTNAVSVTEPKLVCDPRSGLKSGQYFNTACFAPPTGGQDGSIIWPYIHGPAFFNSDLAIYKDFLFKEHQKVEFRFSAFNFLNHPLPQFGSGGVGDLNLNFNAVGQTNVLSQTNTSSLTTGSPFYKNEVPRVIEFAAKYNF
jgi:hypothetical protein